jgi:TrmH family RNA methyltransferase
LPLTAESGLRVVLVRARNPLNIGAAARAMSNFGFFHLRVVNTYNVPFREARSAVGASEVLKSAEEYANLADAVADCHLVVGTTAAGHRELRHPLRRLEEGGQVIREEMQTHRVAILFGSEKVGLTNEELSYCQWLLHIPTREEHTSMNLGQAVAVCLYELSRKVNVTSPAKQHELATAEELDRITAALIEALQTCGYLNSEVTPLTKEKMRRLVRRLNLPAEDAETWLGMLRQMSWRP